MLCAIQDLVNPTGTFEEQSPHRFQSCRRREVETAGLFRVEEQMVPNVKVGLRVSRLFWHDLMSPKSSQKSVKLIIPNPTRALLIRMAPLL